MNNKHIIFAVVTIIVIVAAILISQQRAPQTSKEKTRLFPGLAGKINDVSEISVQDSDKTLTIHRVSGKWGIADADDYPALVDKVKQTVIAVSELHVIAEKTTNPDLYKRLGVEAPGDRGATSHSLTLKSNGDELASLIVGKPRRSQSPSHSPGLYVRLPERAAALLVEGDLSVSADIIQWIKRDIIDIASDRISDIHISHKDASLVHLEKNKPEDDLALKNIPAGKEQESEYAINRMATLLENIYIDGVRSAGNIDYSSPDATAVIKTFDGLTATAQVKKSNGNTYAKFSFAAPPAETMIENNTDADSDSEEPDMEEDTTPTPEQEAENLNAVVNGWAYQLSESKSELFNKPLADLVRDPE